MAKKIKSHIPWQGSNQQRKAMDEEIDRQIVAKDKEHYLDTVAMVLWALHTHKATRFGAKRLKHFYDDFDKLHDDLLKYWELDKDDRPWIVRRMLQEIGVDVEEWEKGEIRR